MAGDTRTQFDQGLLTYIVETRIFEEGYLVSEWNLGKPCVDLGPVVETTLALRWR